MPVPKRNVHPCSSPVHPSRFLFHTVSEGNSVYSSVVKVKTHHIVLFWSLFAVVMTGVMVLVHPVTNRPASLWGEFVWGLGFSVPWMFGTPLTLWLSGRFPLQHSAAVKNGSILFVAGMVIATAMCLAHGLTLYLLHPDAGPFSANIFYTSLFYNIDKMLIVYIALVLMKHAINYYDRYREKELAASALHGQLIAAQMNALKMQLQPHFLFNTMNAIVTLVRKDPDRAEEMIVRLSDFLRLTLESSDKQMVPLREELLYINAYLQIEMVRFGESFVYSERIAPEAVSVRLPVLILQPLVENALKHGISRNAAAQRLEISAVREGETVVIAVSDDGLPADQFREMKEGIGITNTKNRLATTYGDRASVTLTANEHRGMTVRITLPAESNDEDH